MPAKSKGAIAASILRAALLATTMLAASTASAQVMKHMPGHATSSSLPAQPSLPPQPAQTAPSAQPSPTAQGTLQTQGGRRPGAGFRKPSQATLNHDSAAMPSPPVGVIGDAPLAAVTPTAAPANGEWPPAGNLPKPASQSPATQSYKAAYEAQMAAMMPGRCGQTTGKAEELALIQWCVSAFKANYGALTRGSSRASRSIASAQSAATSAGQFTALTGQASWTDDIAPVNEDNARVLAESEYRLQEQGPLDAVAPALFQRPASNLSGAVPRIGPAWSNVGRPSPIPPGGAGGAVDRGALYGVGSPAASRSEIVKLAIEAEQEFGIPPGLLRAILEQESSALSAPGGSEFLISCRGDSKRPKSREEAIAVHNALLGQNKLDCDLSVSQRNAKWHPRSFLYDNKDHWTQFFDAKMAIRWAAWYLRLLAKPGGGPEFINDKGRVERTPGLNWDWIRAVQYYNAWVNEKPGARYSKGVLEKWSRIRKQHGIPETVFSEVVAMSPNGIRVLRVHEAFEVNMLAMR